MAGLDFLGERYDSAAPVGDHATLFWTLSAHPGDGDGGRIQLAIAFLLPNTPCDRRHDVDGDGGGGGEEVDDDDDACLDYWLGFGLSPQGGMVGADMLLYLPRNDDSEGRLLDAHGVGYSVPIVDECGQDWTLANYTTAATSDEGERDGHVWRILEVERSLQSNDVNEDLPLIDDSSSMIDPTRVLVAWGMMKANVATNAESEGAAIEGSLDLASTIEPHGPSGRASTSVRFFRTPSQPQTDRDGVDSDGLDRYPYIDLLPQEPYEIPGEETTYNNFCFSIEDYPELVNILTGEDGREKGVHIVGFEDVVDGGSSALVHHMDLHGTTNEILGADKRLCRLYQDLVHPWEAGSPTTFELPQEAGIPLGGPDGYRAFRVEVHYNNPLQKSGLVDRSGVRLYYSLEHRPNVAGLMLLGDYMLKLRGSYTVSGKGLDSDVGGMRHSFYCPSACFSNERLGNNNGGVTVFREVLHMHKSGERMTNVHVNSNGSVARASEANRFDFTQGAGYASRSNIPYRIREGDSFVTTCYYSKAGVLWGSSSDEEMCQTFLWYWPKIGPLSCGYLDSGGVSKDTRCEMGYYRAPIDADLERLGPGETCEASNHLSQRSTERFGSIDAEKLRQWPSLLRLVNQWKKNMRPGQSTSNNATLPSSRPQSSSMKSTDFPKEGCHLCPGGQRPAQPDTKIPDFSWTCDELDAAIPVLYSRPELLFFSPGDVAPCEDYRGSFGELCGCPSAESAGGISPQPMEVEDRVHRNGVLPFGAVIVVLAMTLVLKSRQRIYNAWRAVPTEPSEQTSCA